VGHLPLIKDGPGFVAHQRRYHTEMLHYQFNRDEFLSSLTHSGLSLEREFLTGIRPIIKDAPEQPELISFLYKKESKYD